MAESIQVASEIISYCTACKMDLNSVVVAMKGDRVARVQCFTCKKEHTFKAPKGAKAPKAKKTRKKADDAATTAQSIEVEWEKLMNAHKDLPKKNYTMKAGFGLGDKIAHPTFGDGIVGKLIYPNKIEVIFRTDLKILIHAGVPTQA